MNFLSRRATSPRAARWLAALGSAVLLSFGATLSAWGADVHLSAKPSELLVANDAAWQPVLAAAKPLLKSRRADWATMSTGEKIEWHIHSAMLAQSERRWQAAIDDIRAARALQTGQSGRQTAGLVNELLARQALARGDEASLRRMTREAVLGMSWQEVAPAIKSIRQALAEMEGKTVESYVEKRMDLSLAMAKGNAGLPFVMQLLGLRFQLQTVLPHRAALVLGIDDAIGQRSSAGAASAPG